jgi:hypothetical protein
MVSKIMRYGNKMNKSYRLFNILLKTIKYILLIGIMFYIGFGLYYTCNYIVDIENPNRQEYLFGTVYSIYISLFLFIGLVIIHLAVKYLNIQSKKYKNEYFKNIDKEDV